MELSQSQDFKKKGWLFVFFLEKSSENTIKIMIFH